MAGIELNNIFDKNGKKDSSKLSAFAKAIWTNKREITDIKTKLYPMIDADAVPTFEFLSAVFSNITLIKIPTNDINNRQTLATDLNVFENFIPKLNIEAQNSDVIFLANINPELQFNVLDIAKNTTKNSFVGLDTMDLWINSAEKSLKKVITKSDVIMIDQSEARLLSGENNLKNAGRKILKLGAKYVVIKKGEHGILIFTNDRDYALPGYLTNNVKDPTGAGDSFAGAFFGFLDKCRSYDTKDIFHASIFGTIIASYTVENFGVESLLQINGEMIYKRYLDYMNLIGYKYIYSENNFKDYLNL